MMAAEVTYECVNMTFEEAYQTMANGAPLSVVGMFVADLPVNFYGTICFGGTLAGVPMIMVSFIDSASEFSCNLYWTADGISTEQPSSGEPK